MFVLTIDQRRSRRDIDRVPDVLHRFAHRTFVRTFGRTAGDEVQAVTTLLALLMARRSDEGRAAVNRMRHNPTQAAAASALGISRQAMSQRLAVAGWQAEDAGRITAARLLSYADGTLTSMYGPTS